LVFLFGVLINTIVGAARGILTLSLGNIITRGNFHYFSKWVIGNRNNSYYTSRSQIFYSKDTPVKTFCNILLGIKTSTFFLLLSSVTPLLQEDPCSRNGQVYQ
jgi:hypothetical protein